MDFDAERIERLDGEWTLFRQAGIGYPALWLPGTAAHAKPQPSARWHTEGHGYAQYLSTEADGCWTELVRFAHVRTEEQRAHLLYRLWRLRAIEHDVADLSTFDKIHAAGFDPAMLVDDDYSYCQQLAQRLIDAGFRGVLAPSAALVGCTNLTFFGARRECGIHERNRRPDFYLGCTMLSDRAAPPPHTLELTRYHGEPHKGLEEWLARRSRADRGAA